MIYETTGRENRIPKYAHAAIEALRSVALLLAIALIFTSGAFAQLTTADIVGTVTDATGDHRRHEPRHQ